MTYTAQSTPVVNAIYPAITGALVVSDSTTTTTTVAVTAGLMRDQSDTYDINIGNFGGQYSSVPANSNTVINTSYVGVNGIDTGVLEASKLYYVYVIADTTLKNIPAAMVSLASASTNPTMPFGYDIYRLVGYAKTNSSAQFVFHGVYGSGNARYMSYISPFTVGSALNATLQTNIALTNVVPPESNLQVTFSSSYVPATAANTLKLRISGQSVDESVLTGQVATVPFTDQTQGTIVLSSGLPVYSYFVSNSSDSATIKVAGFWFTV